MMTENMRNFIEKNKVTKIIFGEARTSRDKPIETIEDMNDSDRVFYRFEDGESMVLTNEDVNSFDYKPVWAI